MCILCAACHQRNFDFWLSAVFAPRCVAWYIATLHQQTSPPPKPSKTQLTSSRHWQKISFQPFVCLLLGCYGLQQVQRLSLAHRRQSVVSLWEQSLSQAKPNGGMAAKSIYVWKSLLSCFYIGCRVHTTHTRTCTRRKTSRKLLNTRDSGESVSCPSLTVQVGIRSNNIYLQFERAS